MEHERPQHMIDFDEDLVGDVSGRQPRYQVREVESNPHAPVIEDR